MAIKTENPIEEQNDFSISDVEEFMEDILTEIVDDTNREFSNLKLEESKVGINKIYELRNLDLPEHICDNIDSYIKAYDFLDDVPDNDSDNRVLTESVLEDRFDDEVEEASRDTPVWLSIDKDESWYHFSQDWEEYSFDSKTFYIETR